ncbi:MAG: hypothetical protein MI919_42375, partial [Holophagales bacterium]|nr:hypothetical protein [Holophagales bacterium]
MATSTRQFHQFNERFGTEWNPGDLLGDVRSDLLESHRMRTATTTKDRSNLGYVSDPAFDKTLIDRLEHNRDCVNCLSANEDALKWIRPSIPRSRPPW